MVHYLQRHLSPKTKYQVIMKYPFKNKSGANMLTSFVIIENTDALSANEQTAITQIRDAISFDEKIDVTSENPFNSAFEFDFDQSIISLAGSETNSRSFFWR